MASYWKVRTSHERKGSDLVALYGGGPRYFVTAAEAEERCRELNEHSDQKPELVGTYYYQCRFVRGGTHEDADATEAVPLSALDT